MAALEEKDPAVRKRHLALGLARCMEAGLTTVQTNDAKAWDAYRELEDEGNLHIRVMLTIENSEIGTKGVPKAGNPSNRRPLSPGESLREEPAESLLSCHRAKIFSDGSLGAETAAMREPYVDSDNHGVMIHSLHALTKQISTAREHGYRSEIHAIGKFNAILTLI